MKTNFLLSLLFPRWVLGLSVFGWDDLLMMAASTALTTGAQAATRPNMSSTQYGNTPSADSSQEDPFAWVNEILMQREKRAEKIQNQSQPNQTQLPQQY
jgi:hypothetical protein